MKRIISILLLLAVALCGCRRIDGDEGKDTQPVLNVEYVTDDGEGSEEDDTLIICLDAGHGFGDVGCSSSYLGCYEYEVTIDVVKRIEKAFLDMDVEVILTHDGETYPDEAELIKKLKKHKIEYKPEGIVDNEIYSAYERAMYEEILVREKGIDFFLSIHVNSVEHAEYVDGYELYYCNSNPHRTDLQLFGEKLNGILDNEVKTVGYDYEDAYIVTKYTKIPSVLLEIGYATNPEDARKMNDDAWKDSLADDLAQEIMNYINK
ncbi:MAG: N-acetylmuramoyl-L-alanine amidase [Clostridia bacterium]|nr:N-acetylmuramoyl-L-alanine amidase [Clostridia bacterium]